jgi:hypothetical protein
MKPLNIFSFRSPTGPQESWGLESELLLNGKATGKTIPGFILEAQYHYASGYLFVTSWDCGEDCLDVILANEDLQVLDQKCIGAMYDSTYLESHEVLAENQVLLHCDNNFLIRVTVDNGLLLHQMYGELKEFMPYPNIAPAKDKNWNKPWWNFW